MLVAENLILALMPHLNKTRIVDDQKQRVIVEKFIQRLGVKRRGPDQRIRELSGGNQQKGFAGALVGDESEAGYSG